MPVYRCGDKRFTGSVYLIAVCEFLRTWIRVLKKNICSCQWVHRSSSAHTLYCQAQPQLQVKLSLKAELALISVNPATHPRHPHPATPTTLARESLFSSIDQVTLKEYVRTQLWRRPQFVRQMEDDLNFLGKWKMTSIFMQMEDDLKFLGK